MSVRIKHPREHSLVALVVICFLGSIAIITSISTAVLIHEAVVYVPPNGQTIDAAIVALISQQGAIALASIAGLTAMLSSTSPKPPPTPTITGPTGQESVAVTAVNTPSQPVPTDPQHDTPPPPDAMPDPDAADPGVLVDPAPEPAS
jgi:hypothetical protein